MPKRFAFGTFTARDPRALATAQVADPAAHAPDSLIWISNVASARAASGED